jgi:hypothetical protein
VAKGEAIFLDTSIAISRLAHAPEVRTRINARLKQFDCSLIGEIVVQEFKRRYLGEIRYLLEKLADDQSELQLRRRLDLLPRQQLRKYRMCNQILNTIFETASDAERLERLRLQLRYQLLRGLNRLTNSVTSVLHTAGCACAQLPIEEVRPFERYTFPNNKCSRTIPGACKIQEFLEQSRRSAQAIQVALRNVPAEKKTKELSDIEAFLHGVLADPSDVRSRDPCLKVGDLLIALESASAGARTFYTLNGRESQHLARALCQTLVVGHQNPEHGEVECQADEKIWPEFKT